RATPEVPRLRSEVRTPMLDLGSPETESRKAAPTPSTRRLAALAEQLRESSPRIDAPAGMTARVVAAMVDFGLLALIDLSVVYFTMKICGIALSELAILP